MWRSSARRAPASHRCSACCSAGTASATANCWSTAQLWNTSLGDNLSFSSEVADGAPITAAMAGADLRGVVQRLPDGLRTPLGEGGGLLSGGEGQRVRLARAMAQEHVRLVLLDEPFRGTDRQQRQRLLTSARRHWAAATLLCATHDIAETLSFSRVLVIENGRIVEDGNPARLADTPSRYVPPMKF